MNGAEALVRTLVASGVRTCFMNPGTSEMHTVAALDAVPEMRGVLCLFEGGATGGADGFGRMAPRPAATLLHLGPGLGNGLANLHNARKGMTPIVNIVGDHATYHKQYDAQLESDIYTVARNVSKHIGTPQETAGVAAAAADAVAAAIGPPGQVATLILPADLAWTEGAEPAPPQRLRSPDAVAEDRVIAIAKALRSGEPCGILIGGRACRGEELRAAGRIAAGTGAKFLCETFPARLERGAGIPAPERIAYLGELAAWQLGELRHLVVVDSKAPVAFFAYPDKPSVLTPEGCEIHVLAAPGEDALGALTALADELGVSSDESIGPDPSRPSLGEGPLSAESVMAAMAALMPEGAIISDEGITSSIFAGGVTAGCPPHDWLAVTGGAIGQGLPVAVGAAVACPDRRVIAIEADGSAMYTFQSLWTAARESLDITVILCNNSSYSVLNMELNRVGAEPPGPKAKEMLDLHTPDIDFVSLARGLGVPGARPANNEELSAELQRAFATPGPYLIDCVIPPIL